MTKERILEILHKEANKPKQKINDFVHGQSCGKMEAYSHAWTLVKKLNIVDVSGSLNCWVKDTTENEKILVRESENGLKYLIFDDDSISYARVGKKIGEHETIHFNEKNGKSILEAFSNDR